MEILSLIKSARIAWGGAAVAMASNTDSNSTRFHMGRYQNVVFITSIEDCANTGVATLKVEANSADSDSGMTLVTGASAAKTSGADDDLNGKLLIVEVRNVRGPYVQAVRTSATANIAFGSVIAVFFNGSVSPVTLDTTVATATVVVGP